MAKSPTESLMMMLNAAYRIRISTAKSEQEKLALEKEKERLLKKASQDPSSLRWYHMAQLESQGLFWDIVSLRKPLNLGSIAMDALRTKMAKLVESIRSDGHIDRRAEPKLSEPLDTGKIANTVLGALVPSDASQDGATAGQARAEVAARDAQKSFAFPYGPARANQPARTATIQGFSSLDELIEAIANGQTSRQLAEVLHRIRPQSGEGEMASQRFAVLLLEGIGKRMVKTPITNAQFLNLQIYMVVGIKQIRPEIDPNDAYDRFAEDMGQRLKAEAEKAGGTIPTTLNDIPNIIPVTSGMRSVAARNRDVLSRSGVEIDQPPAQVVSMLLEAARLGLVPPPPPLSPDRLTQIARQLDKPRDPSRDP